MSPHPAPRTDARTADRARTPAPGRRKRRHPAEHARKVAAGLSVATFATLTGGLAVHAAVSPPTANSRPSSATTTTIVTTPAPPDAASTPTAPDASWSATAGSAAPVATTQSHGS